MPLVLEPTTLDKMIAHTDMAGTEFAFACVDMMGHLNPMLPLMHELIQRGHHVTCFLHDDVKYRKHLDAFGLSAVRLLSVPLPNFMKPRPDFPLPGKWAMLSGGGPLAFNSAPLFDLIVRSYDGVRRPVAFIVDFFTTAALDAADTLGVPALVVFPNPLSLVSLSAPWQRGLGQQLKAVGANLGEAILARALHLLRSRERSRRNLPALTEQDVYPSQESTRPFIVTTGFGFEYPFAHS